MHAGMDHSDFEEAVARHQRKVHTFARYFLSNREEAEDVTQEVLFRLWRNMREVAPEKRGAWLLKVTRNACYDRLRRRRSGGAPTARLDQSEVADTMAARDPDPEALAAASQLGGLLVAALRQLAEPQRSVVILREIQGLKCREIGDVLDMSPGTVRVTLHRGRRRLREHLREDHDGVAPR